MSFFIPGSLNVEILNILCMFLIFDKNFLSLGFYFFQPYLTNSYAVETRDAIAVWCLVVNGSRARDVHVPRHPANKN